MLARQQVATFAKIESIRTPLTNVALFEFRPDRGWTWLQKATFAVLSWIGAHHEEVVTTFQRTPQENDSLLKSLVGQEGTWIELIHGGRNQVRIYMGPDDRADLLRLCEFRDMAPTTFTGRIETRDSQHDGKWHDIPITVVPWMKGAVIVPR